MRVKVTVQAVGVERYKASVRRSVESWVPRAAILVREEMVNQIRTRTQTAGRTGFLRNSVTARLRATGFDVAATASYASFVDQPTRPHEIRPRNKKALAFPRAGGIATRSKDGRVGTRFIYGGKQTFTSAVFATKVRHPGTRGTFFRDATLRSVQAPITQLLTRTIQDGLRASGAT